MDSNMYEAADSITGEATDIGNFLASLNAAPRADDGLTEDADEMSEAELEQLSTTVAVTPAPAPSNRGFKYVPRAGVTGRDAALDSFAQAVSYQLRAPDSDIDHVPDLILPDTYTTLLSSARTLTTLLESATDPVWTNRCRGKALQFLIFERTMLKEQSPRAFIARYIKKEQQKEVMRALRVAVKRVVDLASEKLEAIATAQ